MTNRVISIFKNFLYYNKLVDTTTMAMVIVKEIQVLTNAKQ